LAETRLQTGLGIREMAAARAHAEASVVSRSATAASASAATSPSAAASSVSMDAFASSCASRPARRACARSCSPHALPCRLENRAPLFARCIDARPGGSFGCDDRQRRGVLGFEHAIDRIGNGSVWCCRCHRRTNASQRRRG